MHGGRGREALQMPMAAGSPLSILALILEMRRSRCGEWPDLVLEYICFGLESPVAWHNANLRILGGRNCRQNSEITLNRYIQRKRTLKNLDGYI